MDEDLARIEVEGVGSIESPIVDADGVMSGAIGVSGSTVENDHTVAEAGAKAIGRTELPAHPWRT